MAVLLLGNGINRSEGLACSWDDLLKSALKEDTGDIAVTGESPEKVHELPSVAGLTMTLGFDLQEFYAIDHSIAENSTEKTYGENKTLAVPSKDGYDFAGTL